MNRYITLYYFSCITGSIALVDSSNRLSLGNLENEQCVNVCSDRFFLLPMIEESQNNCQRGCRFANIIELTEGRNLSDTSQDCHMSCEQSYINRKSKKSCFIGCDAMALTRQNEIHNVYPHLTQHISNEQEFDSIENDFFLDPLIRQQVTNGYNMKYKIPEAYIRTLPIDNEFDLIASSPYDYNDNVICSSIVSFICFCIILIGFFISCLKIMQSMQVIESKIHLVTYSILQKEKDVSENVNKSNAHTLII